MLNSNESEYGSRLMTSPIATKTRSFDFKIEISFKITYDYHR